jgi:hypothetical protein
MMMHLHHFFGLNGNVTRSDFLHLFSRSSREAPANGERPIGGAASCCSGKKSGNEWEEVLPGGLLLVGLDILELVFFVFDLLWCGVVLL